MSWLPAPARPPQPVDEVHLWRAQLDRHWPGQAALPSGERRRAQEIQFAARRRRWVAARWVLRLALSRYLRRNPAELELVACEHGKPTLAGQTELRFNLSHSEDLALVAITAGNDVGIDVERVGARHTSSFYRHWSRREAAAKCTGAGIWGPVEESGIQVSDLDLGPDWAAALALRAGGEPALRRFELEPAGLPR